MMFLDVMGVAYQGGGAAQPIRMNLSAVEYIVDGKDKATVVFGSGNGIEVGPSDRVKLMQACPAVVIPAIQS